MSTGGSIVILEGWYIPPILNDDDVERFIEPSKIDVMVTLGRVDPNNLTFIEIDRRLLLLEATN